jgi:hypothetical protein
MQPYEVMRQAIMGHVKGVALRMGKSVDYVYKMIAHPEDCRYTRFLQAFRAAYPENPPGAEAVFEDFRAQVQLLREESGKGKTENADCAADWIEAVRKTVHEGAEAIEAAIEDRDPVAIQKEIADAITSLRDLNKLVVRRADREPLRVAAGGER